MLTTLLQLIGAALVVIGVGMAYLPAGLIVAGLLVGGYGWLEDT